MAAKKTDFKKLSKEAQAYLKQAQDLRRKHAKSMHTEGVEAVDKAIKDVEEVVVKPLSSFIKDIVCFHGTTILGDGRVIMILDCNGIATFARGWSASSGPRKQ